MKLHGSHKFKTTSQKVFNSIFDPEVLKANIPGCNQLEYIDPTHISVKVSTSLPGLRGPYNAVIRIVERQEPNRVVLRLKRKGKGGSIEATAHITLTDGADGSLLNYDADARLDGLFAMINSPIGERFVNNSLKSFFKNLDKTLI